MNNKKEKINAVSVTMGLRSLITNEPNLYHFEVRENAKGERLSYVFSTHEDIDGWSYHKKYESTFCPPKLDEEYLISEYKTLTTKKGVTDEA